MMREQSSARKCIYKISKNFRVRKIAHLQSRSGGRNLSESPFSHTVGRVFACGEDSHALRLVSELPDLRAANVHRRRIRGSVRTGATPSQQKRHPCGCLFCWLGWPDLNRRMPESKSGALPLGDIPIFCQKVLYHRSLSLSRIFYLTLSFTFICSAPLIFKKRLRKVEIYDIL